MCPKILCLCSQIPVQTDFCSTLGGKITLSQDTLSWKASATAISSFLQRKLPLQLHQVLLNKVNTSFSRKQVVRDPLEKDLKLHIPTNHWDLDDQHSSVMLLQALLLQPLPVHLLGSLLFPLTLHYFHRPLHPKCQADGKSEKTDKMFQWVGSDFV